MKWIKAEGVDFKYIFPDDEIMEEEDKLLRNEIMDKYNMPLFRDNNISKNIYKDIYKRVQHGDSTRLAIFKRPIFPETKGEKISFGDVPYCIVWNNNIDLKELDKKIKNNNFSDLDFINSIRAYIRRIVCLICRQEYLALVIDSGAIYVVLNENGKPDVSKLNLLKNKMSKFNFEKCPNCNSPFTTIYVAKILYKCEDKKFTY